MAAGTPQFLVEPGKQPAYLAIPAVEKIIGKVFQTRQGFRYAGLYLEGKACARHD
jgi:hypothetical protein